MCHIMKLFLVRRIVTEWWRGIGAKVNAMVDDIVLEMVDGEEEEEEEGMVDIVNEYTLALIPC